MQSVTEFHYLGRVLTITDDDWPAVARNLRKARVTWGRLARILGREGADPKVSHNFYIAVTQQVLLFGAETWVLTKRMEAALDAFQGRVDLRLTRRMPRRGRDGKWLYLPLAGATKEAGIVRARTLVLRRQNRPRRNELRDRILSPEDRCPRPHYPRFLGSSRQGGV